MAQAASSTATFGPPLSEMNTTPLIDVMLVLLVMLILAVPAAVNQIPIDLPIIEFPDRPVIKHDKNLVSVTSRSDITWNGQQVSQAQLGWLLHSAQSLNPEPELQFGPDPDAPYDMTAKVLNTIKGSGVSAFGFVGNEKFIQFGKPRSAH